MSGRYGKCAKESGNELFDIGSLMSYCQVKFHIDLSFTLFAATNLEFDKYRVVTLSSVLYTCHKFLDFLA